MLRADSIPHNRAVSSCPWRTLLELFLILVRDQGCRFLTSPNAQDFVFHQVQPLQSLGDGVPGVRCAGTAALVDVFAVAATAAAYCSSCLPVLKFPVVHF